jgi:hypothetical protein
MMVGVLFCVFSRNSGWGGGIPPTALISKSDQGSQELQGESFCEHGRRACLARGHELATLKAVV